MKITTLLTALIFWGSLGALAAPLDNRNSECQNSTRARAEKLLAYNESYSQCIRQCEKSHYTCWSKASNDQANNMCEMMKDSCESGCDAYR